jgi:hypothetical protein
MVSFGSFPGPQIARSERTIFRLDPIAGATSPFRVRIRAMPAACPDQITIDPPDRPVYVWLSTIGLQTVLFGPIDRQVLSLSLHPDEQEPSFSASSEHASDSQQLRPELVGHVATLDGMRLEILDVLATGNTTRDGTIWQSPTGVPAIHVQVRISRD